MNQLLNPSQLGSIPSNPNHLLALREATKIERKAFTDAVKAFTEYVDESGVVSSAPERAYSNFTRQVYKLFGLNKKQAQARMNDDSYGRDCFDAMELNFVQSAERAVTYTLLLGMERGESREAIKQSVRRAIEIVYSPYDALRNGEQFETGAKQ